MKILISAIQTGNGNNYNAIVMLPIFYLKLMLMYKNYQGEDMPSL